MTQVLHDIRQALDLSDVTYHNHDHTLKGKLMGVNITADLGANGMVFISVILDPLHAGLAFGSEEFRHEQMRALAVESIGEIVNKFRQIKLPELKMVAFANALQAPHGLSPDKKLWGMTDGDYGVIVSYDEKDDTYCYTVTRRNSPYRIEIDQPAAEPPTLKQVQLVTSAGIAALKLLETVL